MFKKDYIFYGTHSDKIQQLTARFSDSGAKVFQRNVDVLLFAPIVGFLYGRIGYVDEAKSKTTKINFQQMTMEDMGLRLNYQIITLLDKKGNENKERRIDSAFRFIGKEEASPELDRFNQYILGGVDVLHEKLIAPSSLDDDYLNNLYDFLEDIYERYNEKIDNDEVMELVDLARSE